MKKHKKKKEDIVYMHTVFKVQFIIPFADNIQFLLKKTLFWAIVHEIYTSNNKKKSKIK